ncbi:MAG: hypothetical protein AABW81_00800 [Nanoarchaeota archaeon]
MSDKQLLTFIIEARKRGFSDVQIRRALMQKNWPENVVAKAFNSLNPKSKIKNQVCIFLSDEILGALEKRSKKNMLTVSEQIEDILRRSCIRRKSVISQEKVDDFLVSVFSRSPKGRKSKK